MQGVVPKEVYEGHMKPRLDGFKGAYGCVLFFEDEESLMGLQQKNPMVAGLVPEWSDHSSGMVSFGPNLKLRPCQSVRATYLHT